MKLITGRKPQKPVRALLMDFDGTLSTLRHGWEAVMREMMLEMLSDGAAVTPDLEAEVDQYIDQSQVGNDLFGIKIRIQTNFGTMFPGDPGGMAVDFVQAAQVQIVCPSDIRGDSIHIGNGQTGLSIVILP